MHYALVNFLRNLGAGLRLCTFRRVSRLDFRIDYTQLLLLLALSAGIDIAGDWFRAVPPRSFSWLGAGAELYAAGLLLLTAALIAILNRQRPIALAIPVIALASLPAVQAIHYVPYVMRTAGEFPEAVLLAEYAIVLWIVLILVRSVALSFSPLPPFGWLRAIGGGLLLASPIWVGDVVFPSEPWWRGHQDEAAAQASSEMNAGSEVVLAAQAFLLDHALDQLQDERSGRTDLYFIAFAPNARDDAFREQAEAAQRVMDARWDTDGRSLVLVNNPQTLVTAPFATVSNLRETLNEIGGAMDGEDDVVMLYLASTTAANGKLAAQQPPLTLVELGPAGLKQLLEDAGIKWRIIVVSACDSGRFVAMQDENTLVITDTSASGPAFGCGNRTPTSLFADAFFGDGLGKTNSFETAFATAKAKMTEREQAAGYAPAAAPQFVMGAAMAEKIKTLGKKGTSGTTALLRTAPRG